MHIAERASHTESMQFSAVFTGLDGRNLRAMYVHLSASADAVIEPNERCASYCHIALRTHQTMPASTPSNGFDGYGPNVIGFKAHVSNQQRIAVAAA